MSENTRRTEISSGGSEKKKGLTAGQKRAGVVAVTSALLLTVCAGGALAYLTDVEAKVNIFTVGEVKIETLEPNYPGNGSDSVTDLPANREIPKDPQIGNTGKNPALIYAAVDIPMADTIIAKYDGTRLPRGNNELFDFRTADGDYRSTGAGWVLLETTYLDKDFNVLDPNSMSYGISTLDQSATAKAGEPVLRPYTESEKEALDDGVTVDESTGAVTGSSADYASEAAYCRRLYGYDHAIDEGQVTVPVFDYVRMANIVEDFIDNTTQNLVITGYAIQSENLHYITGSDETEGLDANVLNQVWQVYMKQSSEVVPSDSDTENTMTSNGGTLNVEMTIDKVHLYLQSGNAADTRAQATTKVSYTGHNEIGAYEYASSDAAVATVDENGVIQAIAPGRTTISCTMTNPDTGNEVVSRVEVTVLNMNEKLVTK